MFVTKLTPLSAIDLAKLRGQLYFLNEFQAYEYAFAVRLLSSRHLPARKPASGRLEAKLPSRFTKKESMSIQMIKLRFVISDTSSNASTGEVSDFNYGLHGRYIHIYVGFHILGGGEEEVFDFDKENIGEFLEAKRSIILKERVP
jgi:hypothetical protein